MAGDFAKIEVEGARELRKALKAVGDDLSELKQAHRRTADAAADFVRSRVPVGNSATSKKPGALRASVRGAATATSASVRWGRKSVPYAGPNEFGGWPKPGATGTGRKFIKSGRYIYPAIGWFLPEAYNLHEAEMKQIVARFNAKQTKSG